MTYWGDVDASHMKCKEVWGGNGATNSHFVRPGLDVWIWSQSQESAQRGGGDLHLLSSCASGRITRMLLADVCSYGSHFAELACQLRDLMKKHVNSIHQAGLISQISRRLEYASQHGGFASTLVCTYFAPSRAFTICNAGHPPPLLYRSRTRQWTTLKQMPPTAATHSSSPGIVDPGEYQQFRTSLEEGDVVLCVSNIFTECRNHLGQTIGLDGLLWRVEQLDSQPTGSVVEQLVPRLRDEHADNFRQTDATLLQCRATATRVSWRDNLLAPFRLLRTVTDSTRFY